MYKLIIFALFMLAMAGICNAQNPTKVSFGATRAQDTSFTVAQLKLNAYASGDTSLLLVTENGTVKRINKDSLFYYVPSPVTSDSLNAITLDRVLANGNTSVNKSMTITNGSITLDGAANFKIFLVDGGDGFEHFVQSDRYSITTAGDTIITFFADNTKTLFHGVADYDSDLSGQYNDRSLVDRGFVKGLVEDSLLSVDLQRATDNGDTTTNSIISLAHIYGNKGFFGGGVNGTYFTTQPMVHVAFDSITTTVSKTGQRIDMFTGHTTGGNVFHGLTGLDINMGTRSDNTVNWTRQSNDHPNQAGVRVTIDPETGATDTIEYQAAFWGTIAGSTTEHVKRQILFSGTYDDDSHPENQIGLFTNQVYNGTRSNIAWYNSHINESMSPSGEWLGPPGNYFIYSEGDSYPSRFDGAIIINPDDSSHRDNSLLDVNGAAYFDTVKIAEMATGAGSDNIVVWDGVRLKIESSANSLIKWTDTTSILATQFDISTKWDIAGNSLNVAGTDKIGSTNSAAWTAVVNNVPVVSFNTTRTTQFGSNVLQSATNGAVIVARDSNTVTGANIIIQNPTSGTNTANDGFAHRLLGVNASSINRENGTYSLGANNTVAQTILANGNIGIGNTNPGYPLAVTGSMSVGANLTATNFQWSPLGNERQLIFSGANGANGYGDILLSSNNTAAASQRLGLLLFGQIESGKSGSAPGLKAAISSLSAGSGGSTGGFGGTLQFMTRPDNNTSDPTAFIRMTIDENGNVNVGSGTQFQVNSSGVITRYSNAAPSSGTALISNGTNFASTAINDISPTVINATGGLTLTSPMTIREIDATSGNITITVTPSYAGQIFSFIRNDASGNTITIQMASGNIQGGASYNIPNTATLAVPFAWNGTKAYICY